jgi:hypothetical protein
VHNIVDHVDVLTVLIEVATLLPKILVVDVGGDDLLVPPLSLLIPHELHQFVVDTGSVRQEES